MLATKNRIRFSAIAFLTLALFISGCTPPGPRALLKGKKLLDRGNYEAAVEPLKTATSLLPNNAQAWNYYGVALQGAGQPTDAVVAYQRALTLDRDLMEAHYNLGLLWLEQNKPDAAKTEFTAYTLRRVNAPDGWLKLGMAQLRGHELASAEKSFSTALSLSTNNAEGLNGLGLVRVQRGQPREAAQYFYAAAQAHPDYAPALLNLATVTQQYLHDDKLALRYYRAYLALTPRPADWDEVNAVVNSLQQPLNAAVASNPSPPAPATPIPAQTPEPKPAPVEPKPAPPVVVESKPEPKAEVAQTAPVRSTLPPKLQTTAPRVTPAPTPKPVPAKPVEVEKVEPEPVIVAASKPSTPPPERVVEPPLSQTTENENTSHGIFSWLHSKVTPLPSDTQPSTKSVSPPPSTPAPARIQPPLPSFPRYAYLSPSQPKAGDRVAASRAFTQAHEFEQNSRWTDAMKSYQQAASLDPSWFEAEYNYGVLASRVRDFRQALVAYEKALAIEPDSVDARYNFALTLKAAGYMLDAVNELEKITAAHPSDARAHLALGNLYAQQLNDPARARAHYLKVLELDPRNPQATDIRFWLSANPG